MGDVSLSYTSRYNVGYYALLIIILAAVAPYILLVLSLVSIWNMHQHEPQRRVHPRAHEISTLSELHQNWHSHRFCSCNHFLLKAQSWKMQTVIWWKWVLTIRFFLSGLLGKFQQMLLILTTITNFISIDILLIILLLSMHSVIVNLI
jgi:hypothetical protein